MEEELLKSDSEDDPSSDQSMLYIDMYIYIYREREIDIIILVIINIYVYIEREIHTYVYIYIYIYRTSIHLSIYLSIYLSVCLSVYQSYYNPSIHLSEDDPSSDEDEFENRRIHCCIHPVSVRRSPSFRTQPLENLTLPMKKTYLSNPAPGENLLSGTGYMTIVTPSIINS